MLFVVGEVIDEVGDDTLFEPLSPDAVGYSDQDDLQVHFYVVIHHNCYTNIENRCLFKIKIINNILDFYNDLY